MWMALAFVGTTPLVALAQQSAVQQQQQPAAGPTGAASLQQGQDTAGTGQFGVFGLPDIPGLNGVPMRSTAQEGEWWQGGTGGAGTSGSVGPTYRGTTPEIPSATPFSSPGSQTGAGTAGNTSATGGSGGQGELADLRRRVDALEREVTTLRGTGGTGTADANATQGNASRGDDAQPIVAVTVEFDGTVRDVTSKHIDVVDVTDGTLSRLAIDDQTRAFKGSPRKQIPLKQLTEGARVQTSFAYISGVEHARDIVVQSSPRKSQQ
jgi:hypothetical protein